LSDHSYRSWKGLSQGERIRKRKVMEILEHANWGRVALTARSLIALHNSGFKLIPPIDESPQYRRAEKEAYEAYKKRWSIK